MGRLTATVAAFCCIIHLSWSAKLSVPVNKRLDGLVMTGTPAKVDLETDTNYLTMQFTAPYDATGENRVHLFLANDENRISELRFTPSGMTLFMYWAPYNQLREIAWTDSVKIDTSAKSTWSGSVRVHRDYLPPRINRYNAAAVYPKPISEGIKELQYDAVYSVTNFGVSLPDLMVLPRYIAVGPRYLFNNDDGYSGQWKDIKV